MSESILSTVKKLCSIPDGYSVFDTDIITHINSILSILNQVGIGPVNGFMIEDETAKWSDFLGEDSVLLNPTKSYVSLRVRLLFDPPVTSYALAALQETAKELEWRLNVQRESTEWAEPVTLPQTDSCF